MTDYQDAYRRIITDIGDKRLGALATCSNNIVSCRTISFMEFLYSSLYRMIVAVMPSCTFHEAYLPTYELNQDHLLENILYCI